MGLETVGVLGIGEMGTAVAKLLHDNGVRVVTTLEGRSDKTKANAVKAGVEDLGSMEEVVRVSDLVLSMLSSDAARGLALLVGEAAKSVGTHPMYGEFNAVAPGTVQAIEADIGGSMDVVDGGIVGGPGNLPAATIYLSGPRANEVAAISEFGFTTRVLGDVVGQASGMKLCYAGMTKGLSTMALDLLLAATALGVEGPVLEQYQRSMSGVLQFVDRFVPGNPKRAVRRAEEMPEVAAMMESLGFSGSIHRAAHERMKWLGELGMDTDGAANAAEVAKQIIDETRK
jgi:3-hydroxyisobutyrate dehydrogenase-like beta-hydroxyacid dehydrogenase